MKLGELISKRRTELGESYEKMAKRARDQGFTLTRTTLADYAKHPLKASPKPPTLGALAAALRVSRQDVVLAVADSMSGEGGTLSEITDVQHVRAWLTITAGRSDAEIARLLSVAESVAEALDQTADRSSNGKRSNGPDDDAVRTDG